MLSILLLLLQWSGYLHSFYRSAIGVGVAQKEGLVELQLHFDSCSHPSQHKIG